MYYTNNEILRPTQILYIRKSFVVSCHGKILSFRRNTIALAKATVLLDATHTSDCSVNIASLHVSGAIQRRGSLSFIPDT